MKQSAGFYHAWRIIQVDVSGQEHWSLPLSHGVKGHSDSLKPLTLKNEGSRWKKKRVNPAAENHHQNDVTNFEALGILT